jgi:2-C-methyl-D-erythritol 4-phosphate cytidylyltransferase/2-C-methyl-D-erythritol 2,4-cyclodiphosphate synthase
MFVTAIIAAAGRGQRFGGHVLKQLYAVGGRPLLERSVAAFVEHPLVSEVIVALPPELAERPPDCVRGGGTKPVRVVMGGARRQDSVVIAFRAADPRSEIIAIHDAARPFVSAGLISRTIEAASVHGAAVAACPSRDTVKRVVRAAGAAAGPMVAETLTRETIFLAQTPQVFRREILQLALAAGERDGVEVTDESTLAERAGQSVQIVEGEASNVKITTPSDMMVAEAIAAAVDDAPERPGASGALAGRTAKPARTGRAGTGYDLHRLVEGRPLIVGGVTIPSPVGAAGHSDADVVCHAVTDAILGAAGLGDIGTHFPDTAPEWKGASSLDLLSRTAARVAKQGFEVGNVDVTVILETPRIRPHVQAMQTAVASALGIDVGRISIKAKTNEGLDAVGRGEAIAAHAIALIRSAS